MCVMYIMKNNLIPVLTELEYAALMDNFLSTAPHLGGRKDHVCSVYQLNLKARLL